MGVKISKGVSTEEDIELLKQEQEKARRKRGAVVREVVDTEETYVEHLHTIVTHYLNPLKAKAEEKDALMTLKQINDVFLNIDIILKVHQRIVVDFRTSIAEAEYKDIEHHAQDSVKDPASTIKRKKEKKKAKKERKKVLKEMKKKKEHVGNPTMVKRVHSLSPRLDQDGVDARDMFYAACIGKTFLKYDQILKIYTDYVNNYDTSIKTLSSMTKTYGRPTMKRGHLSRSLNKQNENLRTFLYEAKQASGVPLPLQSLLITPIQRLPRYVLLLKELLGKTPKEHKDYAHVKTAVDIIRSTSEYINSEKRIFENMRKLLSVQDTIDAPLDLVCRERWLVDEGNVQYLLGPSSSVEAVWKHPEAKKKDKRQNKKESKRHMGLLHFFLFSDSIIITQKRFSVENELSTKIGRESEIEYQAPLWDFLESGYLPECNLVDPNPLVFPQKKKESLITKKGDSRSAIPDWERESIGVSAEPKVKIIKSGWMIKQGSFIPTWRRRFFVLDSSHTINYFDKDISEFLFSTNESGDLYSPKKVKGIIPKSKGSFSLVGAKIITNKPDITSSREWSKKSSELNLTKITNIKDDKTKTSSIDFSVDTTGNGVDNKDYIMHKFDIETPERTYHIMINNEDEMYEWILAMRLQTLLPSDNVLKLMVGHATFFLSLDSDEAKKLWLKRFKEQQIKASKINFKPFISPTN